jgi:transposase
MDKKNKKVIKKKESTNKSVIEISELYIKQLKSIANTDQIISKKEVEQLKKNIPTKKKKKAGRPTKYKPEMCEKVLDYMAKGISKTGVAVLLGIAYKNMLDWIDKYPDFENAIKIGDQLSKHWWEEIGRLNLYNAKFNATLYMMNMQNRHNWSRKLDGKVDINNEHTERKIIEIKVSDKNEDKAEMLEILHKNGALEVEYKIEDEE